MSMKISREEERKLIELAQAGNQQAQEEIVVRYEEAYLPAVIYYNGYKEDAFQEARMKVWKVISGPIFNTFHGNSGLGTWLYKIVRNISLDGIRKRNRIYSNEFELFEETPELSDNLGYSPLRFVEHQENIARLHYCISQLSENHAAVIELRYFKHMSYQEIANIAGIPLGSVMSRLFHARQNLRKLYHTLEDEAHVSEEQDKEIEEFQEPQEKTLFDRIDDILAKEGIMLLRHQEAKKYGLIDQLKSKYGHVSFPQINKQYTEEYLDEKFGYEEDYFNYIVKTRKLLAIVFDASRKQNPIHLSHSEIEALDRTDIYEAAGLDVHQMWMWEFLLDSWQYNTKNLGYMDAAIEYGKSYCAMQTFFIRTRDDIAQVVRDFTSSTK